MACQTQEIPLLLLHSSVVATSLYVYFSGAVPVSVCQSRSPFFGGGGGGGVTVTQIRQGCSPSGRAQGTVEQTTTACFSGYSAFLLVA